MTILLPFQRGKKTYKIILKVRRSFWAYRSFAFRILTSVRYLWNTLYTLHCTLREALLYTQFPNLSSSYFPLKRWDPALHEPAALQMGHRALPEPCSTWQDNFTVFCLNIVQWIWFLIQNNNGIWHNFNSTAILDGMEGFFFFLICFIKTQYLH